jgi:hypothetical protein
MGRFLDGRQPLPYRVTEGLPVTRDKQALLGGPDHIGASLSLPGSRWAYFFAIDQFIAQSPALHCIDGVVI